MNNSTRFVASTIGVYAGLLGGVHGYFELLQGDIAPGSIGINAIGAPCQGGVVWHACLPAMTLVPNFLVTGVLAIIISLIIVVWAAVFIQRKNGGLILILLSILMLLVGAGFIPPYQASSRGLPGPGSMHPWPFGESVYPAVP
jgi:hypothetical protein